MTACNCYVRDLNAYQQFALHYGAHSLSCPVYRKSLDPIDDVQDRENRYHLGGEGACPHCEEKDQS